MKIHNEATVHLAGADAVVTFGDLRLRVATRDRARGSTGCPMHMLVGALGACIALTLEAVARNKGIDIAKLAVRLGHQADVHGGTRFTVMLEPGGRLTDREQKILFRSARLCDVGKLLKGDVQIDYHLNAIDHNMTGKTPS